MQKQMGKHSTDAQKIQFLTELKYNSCRKARQIVGLAPSTAKDIKARAGYLLALHYKNSFLTIEQQIARREGSGAKSSLTENDLNVIFEACTIIKNLMQLNSIKLLILSVLINAVQQLKHDSVREAFIASSQQRNLVLRMYNVRKDMKLP